MNDHLDDSTKPAAKVSSRRPQPSSSSFDFTGGAFEKTRNTRALNYVLMGVFAIVSLVVLMLGLQVGLTAASTEDSLTQVNAQISVQNEKIAQAATQVLGTSPSGSISKTSLESRLRERTAGLLQAANSDVNSAAIQNALILVSENTGATLNSWDFIPKDQSLPGDLSVEIPQTGSGIEVAPPLTGPIMLTIKASTPVDDETSKNWQEAVKALPFIDPETFKYNFNNSEGVTTITAQLVNANAPVQSQILIDQFPQEGG